MNLRAVVKGQGAYLPSKIITNDDLAKRMDTSDTWIRERTGIAKRHIAAEGQVTSDLAAAACHAALRDADVMPDMVDVLIVATSTPDRSLPSTATYVQQKIGMKHGFAFDIAAACSGFVYGLQMADALIKTGTAKRILLVGAETMSRIVDWEDRGTAILFGDGAGAWLLEAQEVNEKNNGVMASKLYSDGSFTDILATDGGVSSTKKAGVLKMEGKEVFRHAVDKMTSATQEVMGMANIDADAIDWVIPHQANIRILSSVMKKIKMPETKLIAAVKGHANTSAATIPLAVAEGVEEGKIHKGQLLALPALGAGLTWGCCILRW